MRKVVGPKVLEPVSDWYRENVRSSGDAAVDPTDQPDGVPPGSASVGTEAAEPSTPRSPRHTGSDSLASAQAAEAFFAGPGAGEDPRETEHVATISDPDPGEPETATGPDGFKAVALAVKDRVKAHNLNVVAAGVAFWALLAVPAVLTAVVSIYGLVASPEDVESQIEDALSGASPEVQSIVGDQLSSVAGSSGGGLAVGAAVGLLLAFWTASGAVAKVIATLNTIWGVDEDRKFVKLRGLAVAITVGAVVVVAGAAFLLAVLPAVLGETGLGDAARWLLNIARFPVMLLVMAVGLTMLYGLGPNRHRGFRLLTWGAVWATVLWLVISGLFSIYTASFASYNETYGSLGAIVVLLLWLFITAFMVLVGAEIDAVRERREGVGPEGTG